MSEYTMMDIERVLNGTSSAIRGTEDELKTIIRQLLPDAKRVGWIEDISLEYLGLEWIPEIDKWRLTVAGEVIERPTAREALDAAMEAEAKEEEG